MILYRKHDLTRFIRDALPSAPHLPANLQPQTFAERLRGVMSWMLFWTGVVCTAMAFMVIMIVWLGDWPHGTEAQRLTILAEALFGSEAGMGAVIVSLAIGGPVGRFKANAGRDGVGFEAEKDDDAPVAQVTTTTTVGGAQ